MYQNKIHYGFHSKEKNGVKYLTIPLFEQNGFAKHCFTTRIGGVSQNEFSSLNLSKTRENNKANKQKNYELVCSAIDVRYESLTLVNYAHGDGVHCARESDAGKGIFLETDFLPCDAMLTDSSLVTAVTLHADCVPIFVADIKKRAVGVGHAGWKGVLLEMMTKMIAKMEECYASKAQDLIVGIGPHLMPCCFEVKQDVALPYIQKFGDVVLSQKKDALFVDMQKALLMQLERCGVPPNQVTCANLCTFCREDLFYSHRRDRGNTGAMGSFITI